MLPQKKKKKNLKTQHLSGSQNLSENFFKYLSVQGIFKVWPRKANGFSNKYIPCTKRCHSIRHLFLLSSFSSFSKVRYKVHSKVRYKIYLHILHISKSNIKQTPTISWKKYVTALQYYKQLGGGSWESLSRLNPLWQKKCIYGLGDGE